jgi:hypothetical protein
MRTVTQEKEPRRHGIPEDADVTPATTADAPYQPRDDLAEALADSDIVTEDDGSGLGGGSSGSSAGGSGFRGHPDSVDSDKADDLDKAPDI